MAGRGLVNPLEIADEQTPPAADGESLQYEYKRLPKGSYIRYLVLNPGQGDEPLSGRLVVEHIDTVPEFDAISYVWRSPHKVSTISCDGKLVHLTASLRDAILRVRLADTARNLWADQVCINQDDLAERGHQVALMGRIYGKSRTTLVWLGDATDSDANEVCSLIADVDAMVRGQLVAHNGSWDDIPVVSPKDTISTDQRWAFLAKLTDCAWFTRVWVVQEAGLSARLQMLYGKREVDWESCFVVLHWLRHRATHIAYNFRIEWHGIHLDRVHVWSEARSRQKHVSTLPDGHVDTPFVPWSFLDVLHSSRQSGASEPRDHVYAFLGHHSASHAFTGDLIVTPDYTVNVAQVYLDFATRWIEWTQDVDILSFVQKGLDGRANLSLPSWIPAWDVFNGSVIAQLGETIFSAGAQVRAAPQLGKDGKLLKLRGVVLDKVEYRSRVFEEKDCGWASENKVDGQSIIDVPKWAEILSNVLSSPSRYADADDQRLLTCIATMAAGLFSGSLTEFESRAAAFLLPYLSGIKSKIAHSHLQALEDRAVHGDAKLCEIETATPLFSRRFIITQRGYYGLVPPTTKQGDACCVIFGAKTPFIVRPVSDLASHYEFIGETYIHGIMKGEIVKMCADGQVYEEDITLI